MNEKLKQSLEGRLGGMRWGERDQQEVFRLIQRKELQDLKHVKRGSGLLAIAIAMLFIVMGAAFALTTLPQPEDERVSDQPAGGEFLPVPMAQYENDYFTLTIDSTTFEGSELAFTATLRMKDPQAHMFFGLGGHMQPGDPGRTPVRVALTATVQTASEELRLVSGQDLDRTPEVLSMTGDTAVISMSGAPQSTGPELQLALQVTWTDPVSGLERTDVVCWAVPGAAQPRILLLENRYITVTLAERRMEGTQGVVVLEITPTMPWYALNRTEADKASLQINTEEMEIHACSGHEEVLTLVEYRQTPVAEIAGTLEETPTGLRCTFRGELPAGHDTLLGYLVITVSPEAEAMHDNSDLPHYAEVIVPMPVPQASAAPAPAVSPTPQPAANRLWIFENDLLIGYSVGTAVEGEYLRVTIDVVPKDAAHVINTAVPGKTSLYVSTSWACGYDGSTPLQGLDVADGAFVPTEEGAQLSALLPFPEEHQSLSFHLEITTIGNGAQHTNRFTSTLYRAGAYPTPAPEAASTPSPMPALIPPAIENGLVTSSFLRTEIDGDVLRVTLDITPNSPDYVINTVEAGKTSVCIDTQWYGSYDHQEPLRPLPEDDPAFSVAWEGTRMTATLPFPEAHDAMTFSLHITTSGDSLTFQDSTTHTCYRPGAYERYYPTATPAPTPRPLPSGEYIGGTDVVSVYMEESWTDGFSADVTLRVRAEDPAHHLAGAPNENGMPDGSTWVVSLRSNTVSCPISDVAYRRDEATGDLLIRFGFTDLMDICKDGMLDLTLTTTNELTWESFSEPLRPVIPLSGSYTARPLHLISSTMDGAFVQGSLLTSDRYHYVGLMLDYSAGYSVDAELALEGEAEVVSSGSLGTSGASLVSFPKKLFPYEGSDGARFMLVVLRVDNSVSLPDPLPVRLTSSTPEGGRTTISELTLSPNRALQSMEDNLIFDTPLLTAHLVQTDFSDGVMAGQLQIRLKDPASYTLDPHDPESGKVYVELSTAVCAYNGDERPQDYQGDCAIMTDVQPDSCMVTFYGHFPDWHSANSADPWCISLIDARAENGRFNEHYNASFRFPQTGSITRYTVKPIGNIQAEGFDFDSGLLVQTGYLNALTIHWTGDANLGSVLYNGNKPAEFLPYMTFIRGEEKESELRTQSYFLKEFDENATYSVLLYPSGGQERELRPLLFIIPGSD